MDNSNSNKTLFNETQDRLLLVKIPEITYNQLFASQNQIMQKPSINNPNISKLKKNSTGVLTFFEAKNKNLQDVIEIELCLNKEDQGKQSQQFFNLEVNLENNLYSIIKSDKRPILNKIDYLGRLIARDDDLTDEITNQMTRNENEKITHTVLETGIGRPINRGIIALSENHFKYTHADKKKAILNFDRKQNNLKKTRKDKNELQNDLFELFSDKSHWTVKALKDKLDQPELFLKEVLNDLFY